MIGINGILASCQSSLLLDNYTTSTAAFSLKYLRKNYTGSCIRVRRSYDNAEQDIGFLNNALDQSAITTFTGANDGFVVTWYDQSGNGYDVTQSTAANQPLIAIAGVIQTAGGEPTILFDGTNDYLSNGTNIINGTDPVISTYSVINKLTRSGTTNDFMTPLGIGSVAETWFYLPYRANGSAETVQFRASGGTNSRNYSAGTFNTGNQELFSSVDTGSNIVIHQNNTSVLASSATSLGAFSSTGGFRVGHVTGSSASYFRGYISEIVIYPISSIDSSIRTFIMNRYGI